MLHGKKNRGKTNKQRRNTDRHTYTAVKILPSAVFFLEHRPELKKNKNQLVEH